MIHHLFVLKSQDLRVPTFDFALPDFIILSLPIFFVDTTIQLNH
jgi:hypothetical protein